MTGKYVIAVGYWQPGQPAPVYRVAWTAKPGSVAHDCVRPGDVWTWTARLSSGETAGCYTCPACGWRSRIVVWYDRDGVLTRFIPGVGYPLPAVELEAPPLEPPVSVAAIEPIRALYGASFTTPDAAIPE